jgi:magnesium chelatase family protein
LKPHPCGFYGDTTPESRCTGAIIQRYLGKISDPLLDRINLHIEVPAVPYQELRSDGQGVSSAHMPGRVERAREIQHGRGFYNAFIPHRVLRDPCAMDDRILKVARTIADLGGAERVAAKHLAEGVPSLDRNDWQ